MGKISIKTKIETTILLIIVISMSVASVVSVTRTISNTHDDFDTFIHNTKGNYWEATGENLQNAVWDLNDTSGGTVYVGSDVTLSSPLRFGGPDGAITDIIVDFQKNTVFLDGDISFVEVTATRYCTVKNVHVMLTNGHTASIIKLYHMVGGVGGCSWEGRVRYNNFENIQIENPNPSNTHYYTGIHLLIRDPSSIYFNTFKNIQMRACNIGIHLEWDNPTDNCGSGNGNYFEHIWIDQYVTMVWFDVPPNAVHGFNNNVFNDVKGETATYSLDGFKDISHNRNHFYGCLCWDWYVAQNGNYDWSIASNAYDTYICAHRIVALHDEGINTKIE
jgi:hypothetical protein